MLPSSNTEMATSTYGPRKTPPPTIISPFKVLYTLAAAISLLPYIWAIGIVWLAVRVKLYLGYWPTPSHPDPQFVPFQWHQAHLWRIFEFLWWSILIVPAFYLVCRFLLKRKLGRGPLWVYLGGWVLVMVMVFVPRIDFVMWFMD